MSGSEIERTRTSGSGRRRGRPRVVREDDDTTGIPLSVKEVPTWDVMAEWFRERPVWVADGLFAVLAYVSGLVTPSGR